MIGSFCRRDYSELREYRGQYTSFPFLTLLPAALLQIEVFLSVISAEENIYPAHASLHDVMRKIGNGVCSLNVEPLNFELP